MTDRPCIIEALGPDREQLFAAVDRAARFVEGKVCPTRFSALLAPYRDRGEAEAALKAGGGTLVKGGAR